MELDNCGCVLDLLNAQAWGAKFKVYAIFCFGSDSCDTVSSVHVEGLGNSTLGGSSV